MFGIRVKCLITGVGKSSLLALCGIGIIFFLNILDNSPVEPYAF